MQSHRRFNLGKSTIRCSENDDVSSRSSPMVSLSKSIQQVTNREAVGVLQGQRLANSQYDDNSTLAFSFPEETDSPWQLRPKMFAYFCSNKFFSGFKRVYMANGAVWPRRVSFHSHILRNQGKFSFILSFKHLQRCGRAAKQWE